MSSIISENPPVKVRSRPSIVDIFIYDIQAMLGGILPEHHALCLNTPAFSLQFIVPRQSHIKRRVVNRSIVSCFTVKNPPSKETTHAYNTFALWQLYQKRGRVINDGLSG